MRGPSFWGAAFGCGPVAVLRWVSELTGQWFQVKSQAYSFRQVLCRTPVTSESEAPLLEQKESREFRNSCVHDFGGCRKLCGLQARGLLPVEGRCGCEACGSLHWLGG